MITLDGTTGRIHGDISFRQLSDPVHGETLRRPVIQRRIKSTGRLGDFFHPCLVEARLHDFAGRIAHKFARTKRDLRSLGRTDAHGENADSVRAGLFGRHHAVGIEFLAVGDDDERA